MTPRPAFVASRHRRFRGQGSIETPSPNNGDINEGVNKQQQTQRVNTINRPRIYHTRAPAHRLLRQSSSSVVVRSCSALKSTHNGTLSGMSPSEPRWCGGDWWTLRRFRLVRYIFWYCSPYLAAMNLLVVPILRCVLMLFWEMLQLRSTNGG